MALGGTVIIVGEAALSRPESFGALFATDVGGGIVGGVGLITIVGAQARSRRVRIHLGLRGPIPEHRVHRRRRSGGVLLALAGLVVVGTMLRFAADDGCGAHPCEGSPAAVIVPSSLGSLFTLGGVSLLAAGGAARFPARGRVRISVGAAQRVPTLTVRF